MLHQHLLSSSHQVTHRWTEDVCVGVCVQISDAVYSLVQGRCLAQYEELLQRCEAARSSLEASIRTDMDQIISSKEHLSSKIRGWDQSCTLVPEH